MPLRWREATANDRAELQQFRCAYPQRVTRRYGNRDHARPYQVKVQSWIRNLKPACHLPHSLQLGFDDGGLACVLLIEYARIENEDDGHFIALAARQNRCHGSDYGAAMMHHALALFRTFNEIHGVTRGVWGKIHRDNSSSKRMVVAHGFERFDGDGEFGLWGRDLSRARVIPPIDGAAPD